MPIFVVICMYNWLIKLLENSNTHIEFDAIEKLYTRFTGFD